MSLRRWARSGTSCDQEAHSSGAFFGSAKARSIEPAPGYDTGARADLRRNDQGRPLDWAASSTFDARYLTSVDPLRFPYGDGVFGLQRYVSLTYEEWVRYLLERLELEYHCAVPF